MGYTKVAQKLTQRFVETVTVGQNSRSQRDLSVLDPSSPRLARRSLTAGNLSQAVKPA
jgi:hypothetical protein